MADSNQQHSLDPCTADGASYASNGAPRATNQASETNPSSLTTQEPKSVNSPLEFLISCYEGAKVEPWTIFKLTPKEHKALWSILEKKHSLYNYVLDKLRFDWSPHTSTFIVRMPSTIHDNFTADAADEIWDQLQQCASKDAEVATVFALISKDNTSDIELFGHEPINGKYPQKSPDASFGHKRSRIPSIIIETSYTQNSKDLPGLADDYIIGSLGDVKVMIGLDIEHRSGSKRATVSIWRSQLTPDSQEEKYMILETIMVQNAIPFRADNGTKVRGGSYGLSLKLSDFVTTSELVNISSRTRDKTVVRIKREKLFSWLQDAEARHETKKDGKGLCEVPSGVIIKKRPRETAPSEELTPKKGG